MTAPKRRGRAADANPAPTTTPIDSAQSSNGTTEFDYDQHVVARVDDAMTETATRWVKQAYDLHARGFNVFPADHPDQSRCIGRHGSQSPCDGQRGKHPAVKFGSWAATVTDKMIDLEWSKHRGLANPAIACGPSNLVVFDEDAAGEITRWEVTHGITLPDTYTVDTGRGRHLYFQWDHTAERIGNVPKAVEHFKMDVRGDGGYVIAAGAQHVSGNIYTGNGLAVAPLPDEVATILLAAQTNTASTSAGALNVESGVAGQNPNTAKIPFSERHDALVAYAGRLRKAGLDYVEAVPVFQQRWLLCEQPEGEIPEAAFHSADCPYPVTWDEARAKLYDVYNRYPGGPPDDAADDQDAPEATTWEAIDLGPWLDGNHVSPKPTVGISRSDGQKLIYPGKEHSVYGETEAGKSWFVAECAAVEMRNGNDVVYIHYEEGGPGSTIERQRLLGVTDEDIRKHLRFVAPARPSRAGWLDALLHPPPVLVIHDGVNEAMSLHGDDSMATDGAATFRRNLIKPCLAAGAATIACDHVTKASEGRGRYAIGSAHKVAAIDGAAFMVENVEPFGRGMRGASRVYVTKDRPGQLRAHGKPTGIPGKTFIGILTVDATGNSPDFLVFWAPKDDSGDQAVTEPQETLADEIYRVLCAMPGRTASSQRRLFAAMRAAKIGFRDASAISAIEDLLFAGRIVRGNKGGYRAVETASQPSDDAGGSQSASASASPNGGKREAGAQDSDSCFREAAGSTGKQYGSETESPVCGHCRRPLKPDQYDSGHCYLADCKAALSSRINRNDSRDGADQ